jgi:hypothetical protein
LPGSFIFGAEGRRRNKSFNEDGAAMRVELLRFGHTLEHDPAMDAWFDQRTGELGTIARE